MDTDVSFLRQLTAKLITYVFMPGEFYLVLVSKNVYFTIFFFFFQIDNTASELFAIHCGIRRGIR